MNEWVMSHSIIYMSFQQHLVSDISRSVIYSMVKMNFDWFFRRSQRNPCCPKVYFCWWIYSRVQGPKETCFFFFFGNTEITDASRFMAVPIFACVRRKMSVHMWLLPKEESFACTSYVLYVHTHTFRGTRLSVGPYPPSELFLNLWGP